MKKLHFSKFLEFIWTWTLHLKKFWTVVGLDLVLKNQNWIWIVKIKIDIPLISDLTYDVPSK